MVGHTRDRDQTKHDKLTPLASSTSLKTIISDSEAPFNTSPGTFGHKYEHVSINESTKQTEFTVLYRATSVTLYH